MSTSVTIFTAEGCGACTAATEKLALLGLAYEERDVFDAAATAADVRAVLAENDHAVPLLRIDGDLMGYPAAMRRLKDRRES